MVRGAWRRPSEREQRSRALATLEAARRLYLAGHTLTGAVQNAASEPILSVYALRALVAVVHEPVPCWERRPDVDRHAVRHAIDRAISLCRAAVDRGGWRVSP